MYGLYSRAASNQEGPMMARVRYVVVKFAARSLPNSLLHVCVATPIAQKILVESSRL